MPFAAEMRPVHAAIKDVCETLTMKCERADDIYSQRPIFSTILHSIMSSEVIIADLTGKNPNVFYETGIAHSLREPQSVILISQSLEDVPFDLRHLPIVLYRLENMQRFQVELEHRIIQSRSATAGINFATRYLFPLHFQAHEIKSFIDYSNEISESFFPLLARSIRMDESDTMDPPTEAQIQELLSVLSLVADASNGRWRRIADYLKLEILTAEQQFDVTRERCLAHLQRATVSQFNIDNRDEDNFRTELCFRLIGRDLAKTRAITWLLEYLHNPRMGNVDVIRYKIETYIVESEDPDLDAPLLSLLASETPAVRENAADMIGQKSIPAAGRHLTNALTVEEDPYAARSIITALARQNAHDATDQVVEWISLHRQSWWMEPISITLRRVSEETVRKLDGEGDALRRLQEVQFSSKSENSE
jgi:hypothetical protein